ncbi:alpha-L-fucosidase [Nonomuraea sp. NBC_01738]|uniref:alpha-L-fucosidase n=1 Tax=Nonomuraea sp. NBC_01738 TaxID=2976003 RepID=UPI002E121B9A|nr:alpha-L-fucosidase [Nonomuraea sp. NBC_01738]
MGALIAGSAVTGVAAAEQQVVLDVGFGGSFTTQTGYTAATGEIVDGQFARRTGGEDHEIGAGVRLGGGTEGLTFKPAQPLGTTTVDRALAVETVLTPDSGQSGLSAALAVGGNIYFRYRSATELEYGFAVKVSSGYQEFKGSVAAPATGKAHALALAYQPTANGAVLSAFLDGAALPPVTSTVGRALRAGDDVGFGNDVHPSALGRGVKGLVARVVAQPFTGAFDPALLRTMKSGALDPRLDVMFTGSGNYTLGDGEEAEGTLAFTGGTISGLGRLALTGGKVAFTPARALTGGMAGEVAFDPAATGGTLIDLFGAVVLRREGDRLTVLAGGTRAGEVTAALTGKSAHVALAWQGTKVTVIAAGKEAGVVTLPAVPAATKPAATFGEGMTGTVYGVALSALKGALDPAALLLVDAPCTLPDGVEPGWRLPVGATECLASLVAKASMLRPTQRQYDWQRMEQTAFLHFGVNTFTDQEWGYGDEDPNLFQPVGLDTDQWARELKAAGFKLAILTVKHHDGFLLYPSRYTDHDVAASSWQGGRGDVLRDFAASARKYGLKVGVYVSPADENAYAKGIYANGSARGPRQIPTLVQGDDRTPAKTYTYDATDYGAYMLNQLYEVLTQYGQVDEVWFDGSLGRIPPGKTEKYDFDSWYKLIRELQPTATIAVAGPDVRWVGNEGGLARENEWSPMPVKEGANDHIDYAGQYNAPDVGSRAAIKAAAPNTTYLQWWPAEVDVSIRSGWFYHANQQPKSVDQLMNIYRTSVGRNAVLLLNIPPDRQGKLPAADVTRLREWKARIDREFGANLAIGATAAAPAQLLAVDGSLETSWKVDGPLSITLPAAREVDKVVLAEDIRQGQQVESAVVEVRQADGTWAQITQAGTIGAKRILTLAAPVTGREFRVRVTARRGQPYLAEFALYRTAATAPARQTVVYVDGSAATPGLGTQESPLWSVAQLNAREFQPGDRILIRRGTSLDGELALKGEGTPEAPIVIEGYGSGGAAKLRDGAGKPALEARGWRIRQVAFQAG